MRRPFGVHSISAIKTFWIISYHQHWWSNWYQSAALADVGLMIVDDGLVLRHKEAMHQSPPHPPITTTTIAPSTNKMQSAVHRVAKISVHISNTLQTPQKNCTSAHQGQRGQVVCRCYLVAGIWTDLCGDERHRSTKQTLPKIVTQSHGGVLKHWRNLCRQPER